MTRLHIDWTACRGRGGCTELLEGILRSDDWGYPLGEGGSDVVVPTDRLRDAREAVALCPRMALRIQD
ncbi:ferredoxin [Microbacterium sp. RG1]|uniref:ferredoxin n=1 Tax=Microbacterium sp. RG1 TaxID=2489212 RepID=UPI0010CA55AF|nr:ferredoxin [Microbacterium sp. RG1]QCQ17616.1 ferredoxin [Microbacterium sp. RG1]